MPVGFIISVREDGVSRPYYHQLKCRSRNPVIISGMRQLSEHLHKLDVLQRGHTISGPVFTVEARSRFDNASICQGPGPVLLRVPLRSSRFSLLSNASVSDSGTRIKRKPKWCGKKKRVP